MPRRHRRGFTIVELAIVITVIGILAAITVVSYGGVQARTRDTTRINDLKEIQKAVEVYKAERGSYPLGSNGSGAWSGICYGGGATYIVGIESYLSPLPLDPKYKTSTVSPTCYLYKSDGTNYMALAHVTMETICNEDPSDACNPPDIRAMDRKAWNPQLSIAVYSPGAEYW